ncbi:hypothetical protein [Sulfurovum sp.]|uniref:hypothetical protein n=1 Tax=Sulfurovum sp. TaxID=1969726 RepID=UPI0025F0B242|nr:hypothetical protein [Sulfurovum sp.]
MKSGKIVFIIFLLFRSAEAMVHFIPTEELIESSEYIVVAKVQSVKDTGIKKQWGCVAAGIVENKLKVKLSQVTLPQPRIKHNFYTLSHKL